MEFSGLNINLDTNVVMIRECTKNDYETDSFPLKSWARTDVAYDWPFRNLSSSEIERFPSSVFGIENRKNIKDLPGIDEWLEELLSNSKIEKVKDFSKFIHGCSVLCPQTGTVPNWRSNSLKIDSDQMNKDVVSRGSIDSASGESEVFL